MHLEAKIVYLRDALGGHDRVSLEIHLEAEIKLNSEMHLETVIEQVWRSTERPSWIEIGGVLGGGRSGGSRSGGRWDAR
jgi:hypothetical protein